MAYLPWISDEDLVACIADVLRKGLEGIHKAEKDFSRNGIDPFSALFDASCQQVSLSEWPQLERRRQAQKTLQNALGNFHQRILSKVDGWEIPGNNFIDLVSSKNKVVAEVKNKHNTVKKSDLKSIYSELEQAVMHKTSRFKGFTAYYVTIIPGRTKRLNKLFTPSNNETETKSSKNELIREIDGYSFYALVTGHTNALRDLYHAIPQVLTVLITTPEFAKLKSIKPLAYMDEKNFMDFFANAFEESAPPQQ